MRNPPRVYGQQRVGLEAAGRGRQSLRAARERPGSRKHRGDVLEHDPRNRKIRYVSQRLTKEPLEFRIDLRLRDSLFCWHRTPDVLIEDREQDCIRGETVSRMARPIGSRGDRCTGRT